MNNGRTPPSDWPEGGNRTGGALATQEHDCSASPPAPNSRTQPRGPGRRLREAGPPVVKKSRLPLGVNSGTNLNGEER